MSPKLDFDIYKKYDFSDKMRLIPGLKLQTFSHPLKGFEVISTGGGCLALSRGSTYGNDGYVIITDWDGCDLPTEERGDCLIGYYDKDGGMIGSIRVPYKDVLDSKITLT